MMGKISRMPLTVVDDPRGSKAVPSSSGAPSNMVGLLFSLTTHEPALVKRPTAIRHPQPMGCLIPSDTGRKQASTIRAVTTSRSFPNAAPS